MIWNTAFLNTSNYIKGLFLKTKILLLITNLGLGGAQRVFAGQSKFLSQGYAVSEAVFNGSEAADLYGSGNPIYSLDTVAGRNPFDKIVKMMQRARKLKALVQKQRIDICISHMDGANWVNVLSGSSAKKILVVHGTVIHDHDMNKLVNLLRRKWIIPVLYKKASRVVAVSEGIGYELKTNFRLKNVLAIPNGFAIESIEQKAALPLPTAWEQVFADSEVLITSGRLHEQKKQRFLLPLFKRLKETRPNLKLVVLGDGELRSALIEETGNLGLSCYHVWNGCGLDPDYDVYFPGYVTNPFQFLKHSRLFLFPSGWEGFPLALCEAMISGVPVLSSDCPTGPREIIHPGTFDVGYRLQKAEITDNGCLLPMTDKTSFSEVWYQTILSLLDDVRLQQKMIINGKERMTAFHQSVIIRKWLDLIEKVQEEKQSV